jgi:predicted DCC family thiol-disulfide oxidoreductase YuxK
MLTIFYDGQCPMCATEMRHLKQHDKNNVIHLIDLHQDDLAKNHPDINVSKAMQILHGQYQGELLLGLEVTHRAWTIVGKGFWVAPLNWPILKPMSHWVYLIIAKHRQTISKWVGKLPGVNKDNCNTGTCYKK